MNAPAFRLTLILSLAALAVVGRIALLAVPGVSLSFLVVFLSGVAYGPRTGAGVGFLSRLASDIIITGINPIFLPMTLVEAALGVAAGLAGYAFNFGQRGPAHPVLARVHLVALGVLFTLLFSVLADSVTWIFYNALLPAAPDAARGALWGTLVLQGILFNTPSVAVNAILFPVAVPAVLNALRAAGLVEERPEPGPPVPSPQPEQRTPTNER